MRHAVSIARIDVGWVSVSVNLTHQNYRHGSRLITGPRTEQTSRACRFGGRQGGSLLLL
jgi:hypothetical protein